MFLSPEDGRVKSGQDQDTNYVKYRFKVLALSLVCVLTKHGYLEM